MVVLAVSSDVPLMIRGVSAALGEFGPVVAARSLFDGGGVEGAVDGGAGVDSAVDIPVADVLVVDCARPITFADLEATVAAWTARSRIVLLVPDGLGHRISDLLGLGIRGLLLRSSPCHELAAAVRSVLSGGVYLATALGVRLAEQSVPGASGTPLTQRERDVLDLLAQSCTYAEIAASLQLSRHTVKYHVSNVLAKLGVTSRRDAVAQWRADSPARSIPPHGERAEPWVRSRRRNGVAAPVTA